jgi:DNA-binding SARP family transcriptional activator
MNRLPKLEFYLLGAPQISDDGVLRAERPPAKVQALLYYLALTGRAHTRVALATLLWGEHGEGEARRNLRKAIQHLREQFDSYLAIDPHSIGFRSADYYWVDAVEFARQMAERLAANPERLQQTLALYHGDLLEGFYVRDAPDFEAWMLGERVRLRDTMLRGVETLAVRYAGQGDLPQAIAWARRLLELEPWREETHRQLMMWLAQDGQRNAALLQYELCCRALAEELAVEPDAATQALYARLQQQNSAKPSQQPRAVAAPEYALVGRRTAWQTLRSAWQQVVQAGAHFVCINGEAGIGKTRLAEELLMEVQRQGHTTARARAYALEGRLAYAPLADWLRTPILQGNLATLDPLWLSEVARLLPELLIQHTNLTPPLPLTERWQQKRLFEALLYAFTAEPYPCLLLLDDLQWCDAETLAWLQYLLEVAPQVPLCIVGTARSDEVDEEHPLHKLWRTLQGMGKLTTIDLTPLSAEETGALGAQVRKHALAGDIAAWLYQETAGNPLFVVESVRVGLRQGDRAAGKQRELFNELAVANLPPRVYAVIQARLAQLSPTAHTLAHWAATVGRAFSVELLSQASQQAEEMVVHGLDELWQRRIVREQGSARYDFSHDRIRDVAYAEISPVKQALFHQRVAQALERMHAGKLDPIVGELATHYQHAGALEQAFVYFRQAAMVARQLYAHREEVEYLQKAIATAQRLPRTLALIETESDLWYDLGDAQAFMHGWSSEVVATVLQKSYELATQAGTPLRRCEALTGWSIVTSNQGQWYKARELSELALALAEESGDLLLVNHVSPVLGMILHHLGELARAMNYYLKDSRYKSAFAQLPFTPSGPLYPGSINRMAQCLWLLGLPDQARACCHWLLAIPDQHFGVMARFPALCFAAMLYSFLRDVPNVQVLGEELIEISTRCDFPFFLSAGELLVGWAIAQQGDVQNGLSLMQKNMDTERKRGSRMFEPYWRSLLAETLALAGDWEAALDEATEALADAEECGNSFWNAQLLKLKGDFLLALTAPAGEVEGWYQQAIATARQQEAKSLELRATVSLCRLWQAQGRHAEARLLLADIYGWFTEGFDTVDLQEAQLLLDRLIASDHAAA